VAPPRVLTAFTPPGATSVLALEPQRLLREPAWAGLMEVAFPPDQRQAFERLFVVRPEEVREAAWVRWGEQGFVALLRGDFRGSDAVRGLGMRMNTVEVTREQPTRRVGFLGTVRREALELDQASFAYSGDAGPAMATVAELASGSEADTSAASREREELEAQLGPAPVRYLHLVPSRPLPTARSTWCWRSSACSGWPSARSVQTRSSCTWCSPAPSPPPSRTMPAPSSGSSCARTWVRCCWATNPLR
jgi:hypothetical protein